MPATSRRERIAKLQRQLLSPERWIDALLVVNDHEGKEVLRVGGSWDRQLRAYVDRPCKPHVVTLQESQHAAGYGFARWLSASLANEPKRRRLSMEIGNRGGGKTWFDAGLCTVAVALAFPNEWQFIVNITAKQRRECLEHVRAVARPEWIARDVSDFRDLRTEFITGAVVQWHSAQNPRAIRQAGLPIRRAVINEGQDQPESVFINCVATIRNTGGEVGIATNPPQAERGDWVAALYQAIEAGEVNGEKYEISNKLNRAIDQDAVGDIASLIRAVNRDAAEADADGVVKLSGPIAYPAFKPMPVSKGGHIGEPPMVGWKDVTREITAAAADSEVGYDYVCGTDWQSRPGVVGQIAKLYRNDKSELVLHVIRTIGVRGVEPDFSQALIAAGFVPAHGMRTPDGRLGAPLLVVGDATGARQNSEHKWHEPTSYIAMKSDGWIVVPPMRHWKTRTPWNPLVTDSRAQIHMLLERHQILFGEQCRIASEGFASLVESMRRAKVGPRGGLIEKGGFQHCPDGVRYLACRFMPRPQPVVAPVDPALESDLRNVKIFGS